MHKLEMLNINNEIKNIFFKYDNVISLNIKLAFINLCVFKQLRNKRKWKDQDTFIGFTKKK